MSPRRPPARRRAVAAALLASVSLVPGACAVQKAERTTEVIDQRAGIALVSAPGPYAKADHHIDTRPYLSPRATRLAHGAPLPPRVETADGVTISFADLTLRDIARHLTNRVTGLPVVVVDDTLAGTSAGVAAGASAAAAMARTPLSPSSVPPNAAAGTTAPEMVDPSVLARLMDLPPTGPESRFSLTTTAPLSTVLDTVTSAFSANWTFDGAIIKIFRYETRTFHVDAAPGTTDTDATLKAATGGGTSSGAGSSGPGSGGDQRAAQTSKLDFWAEVRQALEALLPPTDSKVVVLPTTSHVVVRASSDAMARVAQYLHGLNQSLGRQIAGTVDIITFDVTDGDDYGLDLAVVFNDVKNGLATGFAGPVTNVVQGAANVTFGVLNPPAGTPAARWNGSEAVFQAISKRNRTASRRTIPFSTYNNKPFSFQALKARDIVASSTGSAATTSGLILPSAVTTRTLETGTDILILPQIRDDGLVSLQVALKLSNPPIITSSPAAPGQPVVQLAEYTKMATLFNDKLRLGTPMVVAGLEQHDATTDRAGVGSPDNPLLGGRIAGEIARHRMVIVITPTEIDSRLRPLDNSLSAALAPLPASPSTPSATPSAGAAP